MKHVRRLLGHRCAWREIGRVSMRDGWLQQIRMIEDCPACGRRRYRSLKDLWPSYSPLDDPLMMDIPSPFDLAAKIGLQLEVHAGETGPIWTVR